jgi:ribosomal protein S24E
MYKLRHIYKNLLLSIFILLSALVTAQEDKLDRAQQLLRSNPVLARQAIDSVIVHPETRNDFISWTTRAYIYYDLYKKSDKYKLHSPLRDTIVSSLVISNKLKPDSDYINNNNKLLVNMAIGCYNIAKGLLQDSLNYPKSLIAYIKYKEIYSIVYPKFDFLLKDLEYYLAVGSFFSDIYIKDNNNSVAGETAKGVLIKVLELQPDNPSANINMGLMYYNQSVNLSKTMDYGMDFRQIDIVQEDMVKLAKQGEQFIVKVYNNDNSNLKAIEALYYIYRMLNETSKSDEFKKKGEILGVNFEQSSESNKKEDKKDN